LSHKLSAWNYEKEVRVFVNGDTFVNVEIVEIVTGTRISVENLSLIIALVNRIDDNIRIITRR
jgi:hypothetical protein